MLASSRTISDSMRSKKCRSVAGAMQKVGLSLDDWVTASPGYVGAVIPASIANSPQVAFN